ncbi:hypothetical protein JOD29_003235 [Lysinibacillus composti]|uniref:Uncharacterized protein n=1 Tax=Lysinibacillus composti TaxID=720633 RepID=A0A3N9UAM5_9BACI|nr:hypothetical protein [Lysinibacillus composti]MBM7609959.1 hypothetical protein [Lysinibacillus composti]RQW73485.1 hypothetical protein EBB45_16580 [Lysinibacillus composti]
MVWKELGCDERQFFVKIQVESRSLRVRTTNLVKRSREKSFIKVMNDKSSEEIGWKVVHQGYERQI